MFVYEMHLLKYWKAFYWNCGQIARCLGQVSWQGAKPRTAGVDCFDSG